MRRLGLEDEFKPVSGRVRTSLYTSLDPCFFAVSQIERMVDEFEERAKAEGEDEEAVCTLSFALAYAGPNPSLFLCRSLQSVRIWEATRNTLLSLRD